MLTIQKPSANDLDTLVNLARETFIQSHGHSASNADIENYLNENYTAQSLAKDLADQKNIYYLLHYKSKVVGYSKIVFNQPHKNISEQSVTKLERIYILESHHGLGLGQELLNFNIDLSKKNNQKGIWLFTWTANKRAIRFYEKMGFEIIGSHAFRISATHSNPNHQFYLQH